LTYDAGQLGPAQWLWGGRDQSGQPVTEGRYRIGLSSGFQFRVVVDRTTPGINATITSQYPPTSQLVWRCAGDRMGELAGVLESVEVQRRDGVAGARSTWQEVQECFPSPTPANPFSGTKFGPEERLKYQYRIIARDLAGNEKEKVFPLPEPALYLESIEGRSFTDSWAPVPEPYRSQEPPEVTAGSVRMPKFVLSPSDSAPVDFL